MEFFDLPADETADGQPLGSGPGPLESPRANVATTPVAPDESGTTEALPDPAESGPNRRSRIRLAAFGLIAIASVGIFGVGLLPSKAGAAVKVDDSKLNVDPVGQTVPNFSGDLLSGTGQLSLASLRGKVVVVNFWASWCSTCKAEAAVLGAVEKQWRSKGVVFLGVDSRDTTAPAKAFDQQYGIDYDSVVDPTAEIGQHFYVTGFPESYFISKSGKVVKKYVSAIDAATLNQFVAAAVAAN